MYESVIEFIRSQYGGNERIPLHAPLFVGNESAYLQDCLSSTFVSSVGPYVDRFEASLADYLGARHAIAVVNGTAALHAALLMVGVERGDEVITQPLTFVATANAISYCGAMPVFLDIDRTTLGLSPDALAGFLNTGCVRDGATLKDAATGRRIAACVPVHTFGHPVRIAEVVEICRAHGIPVIEDAAESIGSRYRGQHTGTFGDLGIFSFNGNKTITCGGGGAVVTECKQTARRLKHLTTTAKVPHAYAYVHDQVGFNYRMPNLNAALACAQLETLDRLLADKRRLAEDYLRFFDGNDIECVREPAEARSNYWLNTLIMPDQRQRDAFLEETNGRGLQTRPAWELMHRLPMYGQAPRGDLAVAEDLGPRIVNIPSSPRI